MIPAALLLLASTLHAGPERPVSAAVRDSQPYTQSVTDVAADDDTALVTWADGNVLRAARVDRDGKTLDEVPLLIAYSPWPAAWVSRGTTGWLVVWGSPEGIQAKTVADDGTVGAPIAVASFAKVPRVAFDGTSFLVAWQNDQSRLFAARISASGHLVETGISVAPGELGTIIELFPSKGGGFLLVTVAADFVARQLDAEGQRVSTRSLTTGVEAYSYHAGLEPDGKVVLAWSNAEGTHLKREGVPTVTLPAETQAVTDFVTVRSTTYAVVRANETAVLVNVTGNGTHELPGQTFDARAVTIGSRVFIATSYRDASLTVLDSLLQTIVPRRLVYAEPRLQFNPVVAQAGDTRLVAWTEQHGDTMSLMAKLGDGEPFVVATDGVIAVGVATDGRDFLLTWHSGWLQLNVLRIRRDGTMGTVRAIPGWTQGGACVAWAGSEYVVGYVLIGNLRIQNNVVLARRVTSDGELSGEPVVMSPTLPLKSVVCASTETTTLFAWSDRARVVGATLSHGGTVSGAFDIGHGTLTSMAARSDGFLVALSLYPPGHGSYATVSEGGTVGLPHAIDASPVKVVARPGGYLLLYGNHPLRAQTLDPQGNATGSEIVIAPDAGSPAFSGDTLLYQRDTDILSEPRWRVFTRTVSEPSRRRSVRR